MGLVQKVPPKRDYLSLDDLQDQHAIASPIQIPQISIRRKIPKVSLQREIPQTLSRGF